MQTTQRQGAVPTVLITRVASDVGYAEPLRVATKQKRIRPAAWTHAPPQYGGFTLIELLVVISISVVVAAAIGACLAGGLRVWEAAQRFNRAESDAIMSMNLLATDLHGTFAFSGIPFNGSATRMSFPGIVNDAEEHRRLGTISYELRDRTLNRRTAPYPEGDSSVEKLGEDVIGIKFEFAYRATDDGLISTGLPWKVDIEIILDDDDGPMTLSHTFWVPVGGGV